MKYIARHSYISLVPAKAKVGKQPLRSRILAVLTIGIFVTSSGLGVAQAVENASQPTTASTTTIVSTASNLVISALQTASCTNVSAPCSKQPTSNGEFIELYNPLSQIIATSNWTVCYRPATSTTCSTLATLSGTITPHGYVLIRHASLASLLPHTDFTFGSANDTGKLALSSGFIEIRTDGGTTVDQLGWSSTSSSNLAPAPAPGEQLQRTSNNSGQLIDTKNNAQDFQTVATYTPQYGGYTPTATQTPGSSSPAPSTDQAPDTTNDPQACNGIIISEILPNPSGSDSGLEYIELHNPTNDAITLTGCGLQLDGSTKTYNFSDITLAPGEYRTFSDAATGITLPNSSGGTVLLFNSVTDLQAATYPSDLDDDVSWSLADGSWAATYTPTPNAPNIITASKPCPEGQERNPETNRCVTISTAAAAESKASTPTSSQTSKLTPCPTGQERNPTTNRCKATASTSATSTLTPCKEGQERNPETNRCRNAVSTSSTPQPCPAGQERNPNTNRCRKIAATTNTAGAGPHDSTPISETAKSSKPYRLIIITTLAAILAYGIYEWRQELRQGLLHIISRWRSVPARPQFQKPHDINRHYALK